MNKKGRPKLTGNKFICLRDLNNRFPQNFCVPISSSFIKKYNLLEEKVEATLNNLPSKEKIDVKVITFTEDE